MRNLASLALASALCSIPRAVAMAPRAEGADAAAILNQLNTAFADFRVRNDSRLDLIEAAVDQAGLRAAGSALGGGASGLPIDKSYTEAFASYVRSGSGDSEAALRTANATGYRSTMIAAMSSGTASDGGYLAPTEWDRKIGQQQRVTGAMRRLATVITTSVGAYSTVWNDSTWGSGWVGETAARPSTGSPVFSSLDFPSGEIYANVPVTQRLLDDSQIDMGAWLTGQIGDEFTRQESLAFITGTGVNKPFGLLAYVTGGAAAGRHPGGNLTTVNSAGAGAVVGDDLIGFAYSLTSPYRQGASWLMNSTTAAALSKLKDAQGDYLWREGLTNDTPATLLGYPVEIDESMPNIGTGNLPIAFGNFRLGYIINDRMGVRMLRDPYTSKPYVNFYATKRVGAGVLDPNAIRLLKIA